VTTQKGSTVYVHILDWPDRVLTLPALERRVQSARLLVGNAPVEFAQQEFGVQLKLPQRNPDDYDTVIVLELAK